MRKTRARIKDALRYATHLFDCDGVLLATNAAKSQAFHDVAVEYGEDIAKALVEYHKTAGSIGREARFRFLFDTLLQRAPKSGELEILMARCTSQIMKAASEAKLMLGIEEYLSAIKPAKRWVISGIETVELIRILNSRLLAPHFERVYGSPPTKTEIFDRFSGRIERPAVFYGDAEEDYLCAVDHEMDFVFIKGDSDWNEGEDLISGDPNARIADSFLELLASGVA